MREREKERDRGVLYDSKKEVIGNSRTFSQRLSWLYNAFVLRYNYVCGPYNLFNHAITINQRFAPHVT